MSESWGDILIGSTKALYIDTKANGLHVIRKFALKVKKFKNVLENSQNFWKMNQAKICIYDMDS